MPPVALTASTATTLVAPHAAHPGSPAAGASGETRPTALAASARPQLRLVPAALPLTVVEAARSKVRAQSEVRGQSETHGEPEVHGWGGPSTCGCRECTMARHPAFMPRLTVVR
ncbi:hypothetical protein [Frankia sp. AiPa1]|uniref:hypothetical protein n=1 Tax=Frankia sp. AiPa1 TaxID=573492 RepID=UPI00202AEA3E|nr:hypothetical protein [Frankia sp. AiPa1]MCL9762542.1 hypothetical protein [Frankia sp. AiPa1]